MISEMARIAQDMNPSWTVELSLKKYRTLVDQLRQIPCSESSPTALFEILRRFYFEKKQFAPLESKQSLEKCLLPYALLSRSAPPEMLVLLFLSLARSLDLPVTVLSLSPHIVVKFVDQGKNRLFVFQNQCRELHGQEVVDLVNQGCDCTQSIHTTELLMRYLVFLKTQSLRERRLVNFYKLQSYLVQHQPFALHHLIDRARAAYAIGDIVRAAEDLGQYVTFQSEKVTNNRYLKLLKKIKDSTFQ